jgi:hypothetical protein
MAGGREKRAVGFIVGLPRAGNAHGSQLNLHNIVYGLCQDFCTRGQGYHHTCGALRLGWDVNTILTRKDYAHGPRHNRYRQMDISRTADNNESMYHFA